MEANVIIVHIKKNKMKTPESLNSFMNIIENSYPQILPLIVKKNEYFVELEMSCDLNKTFDEQTTHLKPILDGQGSLPINKTIVSLNERQECFKIIVNLR